MRDTITTVGDINTGDVVLLDSDRYGVRAIWRHTNGTVTFSLGREIDGIHREWTFDDSSVGIIRTFDALAASATEDDGSVAYGSSLYYDI